MKKWIVLMALTVSLSGNASSISVNSINALIKKNNGGWIASETSVSRLSDFEIKRLLGSLDRHEGNGLYEDRTKSNEALDWRNVNGTNWIGPVLDQGRCGACAAFASVATLEAQYRISSKLSWLNPTFSPQQLFNCGGASCNRGWTPLSAAYFLKTKGIVDLSCVPYESGVTGEDVKCQKNFCQDQAERTYKILDYSSPSDGGGTMSEVKKALTNGPLLTDMSVYEDFMVYSSGIYKSVSNKFLGYHAISIVGFNDEGRYWIVRNSWGTDWGEGGFVRISYDDKSGIGENTWAFETAKENNYISITSPTDHQYVSGVQTIKVNLEKPATSEVVVRSENGESLNLIACQGVATQECTETVDTAKLKDGRYEIYAKSDKKRSQVREFLVVNHEPQTSISFTGTGGVDLSKPQKGKIEFDIDVKASPVIPQRVTFVIEDLSGKAIVNKVTKQVVEHMRLSFKTNTIPNGSYKIYYVAETPFNGVMIKAVSNKETLISNN
jgi:C1A family cysteine protease